MCGEAGCPPPTPPPSTAGVRDESRGGRPPFSHTPVCLLPPFARTHMPSAPLLLAILFPVYPFVLFLAFFLAFLASVKVVLATTSPSALVRGLVA